MLHQLTSNFLKVSIKSAGAEITSVINKDGLEFIWQVDKNVWGRHAPVLFPIVGKLKEDSFIYGNKSYFLKQHGFARDMVFNLVEGNKSYCVFELVSNESTKKIYPFDFILQIRHELTENNLETQYKIINPSSSYIFFSIGAHPGFNCPLLENETFEDYFLEFKNSNYSLTKLNSGLRLDTIESHNFEENKIQLSETLFNNDALVFENNQINTIALRSKKSKHKISLVCNNWPYFGIWSKKGCRQFVCLEPWFGIADHENTHQHLTSKEGIIRLEPKNEFNCSFSLSFD